MGINVWKKIVAGAYMNPDLETIPCPIGHWHTVDEKRELREQWWKERRAEWDKNMEAFKQDILLVFNLADNPHCDQLFHLAWTFVIPKGKVRPTTGHYKKVYLAVEHFIGLVI